jgi:hypothetical protein
MAPDWSKSELQIQIGYTYWIIIAYSATLANEIAGFAIEH